MIRFNRNLLLPSFCVDLCWHSGPRRLPTLHIHLWRWSLTVNSPWDHLMSDID